MQSKCINAIELLLSLSQFFFFLEIAETFISILAEENGIFMAEYLSTIVRKKK